MRLKERKTNQNKASSSCMWVNENNNIGSKTTISNLNKLLVFLQTSKPSLQFISIDFSSSIFDESVKYSQMKFIARLPPEKKHFFLQFTCF